jgi:thymidylate synthase
MAKVDEIFKNMCGEILNSGFSDENLPVRPRWNDGTPAHTIKKFCVVNRYNLAEELPILTLRPVNWQKAIDEILWIWVKKSNDVRDLGSQIWDSWSCWASWTTQSLWNGMENLSRNAWGNWEKTKLNRDDIEKMGLAWNKIPDSCRQKNLTRKEIREKYKADKTICGDCPGCTIGKAYGYQLRVKHKYPEGEFDQVERVLYDLKHNSNSRRIMTNIYVHQDLHKMNLYPCAYSCTFNVTGRKLNMILNQRSQDVLTANGWNVCQYAVLLHMFAHVSNLEPGEFVHVIADAHIYDRHIPLIRELLKRSTFAAPKFRLNASVKNFEDFTIDDFLLENYNAGPQIKVPVAV